MKITEQHIEEIADRLDCGLICHFHRPTGTIESHPDPDGIYFDPEAWHDVLDKIQKDRDNYASFEMMNSTGEFRVMEDFAYSLKDTGFRNKILERLARRKPFIHFKNLIDSSNYRQDWLDFKKKAYIEYVKRQVIST